MASEKEQMIEFFLQIGILKSLPRTGWLINDIPSPETVADHMFRMASMVYTLDLSANVNRLRCLELALVHDMAESIVGDITPCMGISENEKHRMEMEAMEKLSDLTGQHKVYLMSLYKEYEDRSSPEAKLVKEFDMLDMCLQAFEYEKEYNCPGKLEGLFKPVTENKFSTPLIVEIAEELKGLRRQLFTKE